jgi:hypothetical protein
MLIDADSFLALKFSLGQTSLRAIQRALCPSWAATGLRRNIKEAQSYTDRDCMPNELHCVGCHFQSTSIQLVWMLRAECGESNTSKGASTLRWYMVTYTYCHYLSMRYL